MTNLNTTPDGNTITSSSTTLTVMQILSFKSKPHCLLVTSFSKTPHHYCHHNLLHSFPFHPLVIYSLCSTSILSEAHSLLLFHFCIYPQVIQITQTHSLFQ